MRRARFNGLALMKTRRKDVSDVNAMLFTIHFRDHLSERGAITATERIHCPIGFREVHAVMTILGAGSAFTLAHGTHFYRDQGGAVRGVGTEWRAAASPSQRYTDSQSTCLKFFSASSITAR